jgi:hypothetical protein
MLDYTLHLQAKQHIEELRRQTERRHWLRDILNGRKADRSARNTTPAREQINSGQHD